LTKVITRVKSKEGVEIAKSDLIVALTKSQIGVFGLNPTKILASKARRFCDAITEPKECYMVFGHGQ